MNTRETLGGIIHTYQKYDPTQFPSPTAAAPDLVSPVFHHLLEYGDLRELSEEELARAIRLDPSQIRNLGPSLQSLRQMLLERKRKILERYETQSVQREAADIFRQEANKIKPPKPLAKAFEQAVREEQLYELENLYYRAADDRSDFSRRLVQLVERLGEKYQVDELASKYQFTGHEKMTVPKALEVKEELETIDKLLKQLQEAEQTAQLGIIDLEELSQFIDEAGLEELRALQQQIQDYIKDQLEKQGLETDRGQVRLSPKAYRLFQSKLLTTIFSQMQASRTGRHTNEILGEGATETQRTKSYEFGDSITHMDIPQSMLNAMLRQGGEMRLPIRMKPEDIVIHRTRNNPKAATAVLLDMSGSMRYDGLYVNVKRMGLALDGLIRSEYPGDFLQFIEMYSFAKPRHISEVAKLMPKPVTIYNPVVRLKAKMSDPNISEMQIPPHFTNIQHALQLARRYLSVQDTPNRQIVLITDGLPTAHFEGDELYLLYPPDPRTEKATLREALLCARENITINIFLLSSWNQSQEDIRFAYHLAESAKGRVFFTAGRDLDRYVVWDYLNRRRQIIG